MRADSLVPGDKLFGVERDVEVTSVETRLEPHTVFNIEVDGEHVYHVGREGLLVHNANADYYHRNDFIVYADRYGDYIGRTVGDLSYRYGSDADNYIVLLEGLTYEEVRGLEQMGIEAIGGKESLSNRNKRNGIGPNNKKKERYENAAKPKKQQLLDRLEKCK